MTEDEIAMTLGGMVHALGIGQVVIPNQDASPKVPYVVMDQVRLGSTDRTVTADGKTRRGYIHFVVVVKQGEMESEALRFAEQIEDLFPNAKRIPAGDGLIAIVKPPDILSGYPANGVWRVPVRVDYQA